VSAALLAAVAFGLGWFAKTVSVQLEMADAGIWEEFLKYRQAKRAKKG
jgi:hypothetical protein